MPFKDPLKRRAYHLKKSRAWDVDHPGNAEERKRKHRTKPDRAEKNRYLMRRYGMTVSDYEVKLTAQGGVCAICGRPPKKIRLAVDHDHKTGKIRDLLCFRCNHYYVSTHTLETAQRTVAYLERHAT